MNYKKVLFGLSALALFSACTKDFKDWVEPQTNEAVTPQSVAMTIAPAQTAAIDLATVEGETVKLFTVALPDGVTADSYNVKLTDTGNNTIEAKYPDYNITADADGNVSVLDLQNATNGMFNKEAVERTFNAVVSTNVTVEGKTGNAAVALSSEPFVVTVIPVSPEFAEFIYEIGAESSWGIPHALYCANGDGKYQGFYWLDGEFKFKPNKDDWNGDWEYDGEGRIADNGGANMPGVEAGFYRIDVDLVAMTYELTPITSIGIIGGFNSWGGDIEMTFNTNEGCWEATADLEGEFKFRANHDWAMNWGGSFDTLSQDGANLNVEAGTYAFKLFITYAGNHYVEVTKQ